jgi:HrpA-like RNA helicase
LFARRCGPFASPQSVGYVAGSNRVVKTGVRILFMTDAALVKRVQHDPSLSGVSVLIVDEAHERSLNTDLVLGIAKQIRAERPDDFHVVVASATIDPKPFVHFFTGGGADMKRVMQRHVLECEGRVFPVTLENKP